MRDIMTALNRVPDGKQPKNGFDLHSYETFTQKGGQLNVVAVRDTVPNSDYRMSVDGFTRSLPCNTANFAHIKENYYFVHVPLGLINRNAYQMLVQREEKYSALEFGVTQFPTFDLVTVLKRCLEIAVNPLIDDNMQKFRDVHRFNIGYNAFKLFDMLGYGCFIDVVEAVKNGVFTLLQGKAVLEAIGAKKPTANRLAAYQMVWYYFFRNDVFDNEVSARCFNFDDVTAKTNGTEPNYDILSVRSLDDFIIECCQLRYVGYKKDLFTAFMPGTQYGAVSSIDIGLTGLTAEFVGSQSSVTVSGGTTGSTVLNPDGTPMTDLQTTYVDTQRWVLENVNAQYVDVDHDSLSTKVTVQAKDGVSGVAHDNGDGTYDLEGQSVSLSSYGSNAYHYHPFEMPSHSHGISGLTGSVTPLGTVNLSGDSSTSLFDVLQLVEAQAIQKWRQKSMLAGNRTVNQFRAHHGVVPRHLMDHLPDFIGSVDNEIQITEITSQADTATDADESNLGEIAGRGYGVTNNRTFNFHSDDYGILILLHAIVPENTYNSFGIDVGNTRIYYSDFYQSEYTNLGLQAIPKYLLDVTDNQYTGEITGEGTDTFTTDVGVVGYAPRDFGYKTYVSKVHGLFNPSRLWDGSSPADPRPSRYGFGDMQSFVIARRDLNRQFILTQQGTVRAAELMMTLSQLYVHPSLFDSIFSVAASNSETTDTFISHVRFSCDASLPMPILGLPQF